MAKPATNINEVNECLKKLCHRLCSDKDGAKQAFRTAVITLSTMNCVSTTTEDEICHKIQDQLLNISSSQHANRFSEYYHFLKHSQVLKNQKAILEFLYLLSPQDSEVQFTGTQRELSKAGPFILPSSEKNLPSNIFARNFSIPSLGLGIDSSVGTLKNSNSTTYFNSDQRIRSSDECAISEREMIQDVLYAAQGVQKSNLLRYSTRGKGGLVLRISELGFLHDKICYYIDPSSGCMPIGLVGEGLISAYRNELTEYYHSLAILQSQLNSSTPDHTSTLTLRRLLVWSLEPTHRLKWLATIGHACQNKKGGELASCVHKFLSYGDPRVGNLVHQLLATVCYPIYVMLCRWLLDGEIDDPHKEFFIESRASIATDRLWHDKYRVREAMLPAFITKEQAKNILATGKSVTFLREVCGDREQVGEREMLKKVLDDSNVELLFSGGTDTKLHAVMSSAYLGVSRRLLDTLINPHKLLKHLQALRGYLLLGQGDFIQNLMILLEPELNKNANQLFVHNLTSILDSAIRATNAQFEDQDIINRLYVNLFPPSPQDNGWDVFSLFYRVEGPLGTVLDPEASASYRTLFSHLWRAKRMEHTLSQMWKQHTIEYKRFSKMPEVTALLRRLHALRSEMVHLVKELQYALFVVVECAWQNFITDVGKSIALDQLLHAHREFLASVTAGALLDNATKQLQTYLGNVYNEILSLKQFESSLYANISIEYDRRKNIENLKEERCKKGEFGITKAEEQKHEKDYKLFNQYLVEKKADFNVLSRAYRGHVKTFILKLALQNEASLQSLLFRLDYNDFYKRGDSKLHEPLTYQHKRLSEIGSHKHKHNGFAKNNEQNSLEKDKFQEKFKWQK